MQINLAVTLVQCLTFFYFTSNSTKSFIREFSEMRLCGRTSEFRFCDFSGNANFLIIFLTFRVALVKMIERFLLHELLKS